MSFLIRSPYLCSLTELFTQSERMPPHPHPTPPFSFLSLAGSLLPSLHVGSSLRLHFSCLGSLLSSPANKSSANLLPESFCPCSDCSSPWLLGNKGKRRGWERRREGEEEEEGGSWVEVLPNGHPLCRNNRLLSLNVFQRPGTFFFKKASPSFPSEPNSAPLWGRRGDV